MTAISKAGSLSRGCKLLPVQTVAQRLGIGQRDEIQIRALFHDGRDSNLPVHRMAAP